MSNQAEKTDIDNATYPSNLSAALYELGDYAGSYQAILRSAKLLSANPNPKLAAKLSSRLPKALSHGLRDGTIVPKDYREEETTLKKLRDIASVDSETSWREWERISGEYDSVVERARKCSNQFCLSSHGSKIRVRLSFHTFIHEFNFRLSHSGLEYFCVSAVHMT